MKKVQSKYQDYYTLTKLLDEEKILNGKKSCGNNTKTIFSEISIHDTIKFGTYNHKSIQWLVLEKEDNKALIVSTYCITERSYNDKYESVWKNSQIRKWLNSEFLLSAFTQKERSLILETSLGNPHILNTGTKDMIFLLSTEEAKKYFFTDEDREAKDYDGVWIWWWLRSFGCKDGFVASVDDYGCVNEKGNSVYDKNGIRPALWVKLDKPLLCSKSDQRKKNIEHKNIKESVQEIKKELMVLSELAASSEEINELRDLEKWLRNLIIFNDKKNTIYIPQQKSEVKENKTIIYLQRIIDSYLDPNKPKIKMTEEDKGWILYYGRKFIREADYERGLKWIRFAAKHGETDAAFLLGYCYDNGIGVAKNSKIAEAYYRQGANSSRRYDSLHSYFGYKDDWLTKAQNDGKKIYLGEKLH